LRHHFDVTTALGGHEGLAAIREGTYAAVLSDLRMPDMDGITFLNRVGEVAPDTVRLLLTGNAELDSAIDAVNRGGLFRFLTKPVDFDVLKTSLEGAVEQYALVMAERELLEQTLRGSVQTLVDTLSLADPRAFARATRLQQIVTDLLDATGTGDRWAIEVAAMLSQLGMVTLPADTAAKLNDATPLDASEQQMVDQLPALAVRLLGSIPRLDEVRDAIRLHPKHFDGSGDPPDSRSGTDLPLGARMLRIAVDLDNLHAQGMTSSQAVPLLERRRGFYDPDLLAAFARKVAMSKTAEVAEITVGQLREGMRLTRDVLTTAGALLVGREHVVTEQMLQRIRNYQRSVGVAEPLYVVLPDALVA
ncbi:MAG TPA: HD domain-containing phosphohydrolase, partial [Acidimicrobiia bacterium]|nr:HD domain-containing phosphohydrolase [Acidimicrobiia bacterium]